MQGYAIDFMNIDYQFIKPEDHQHISLIADWYFKEWSIATDKAAGRIQKLSAANGEFHVLMKIDGVAVATGGIHTHIGLHDREPRFKIYKNWLAWVYTTPLNRGQGFGAMVCEYIQEHAKAIGLTEIYLFTHTAERLYKRLEWQEVERVTSAGKNIVVMRKDL